MIDRSSCENWYVVRTKPRQVARACVNLERQGFSVFVPEREETLRRQGRFVTERRPLFGDYVFVQLKAELPWHPIRNTLGVAHIVSAGSGLPAQVPVRVMQALFARFAGSQMQAALRAGRKARILRGPLAQLVAKIEDASEADRIQILLDVMGGPVRTTVPRDHLQAV